MEKRKRKLRNDISPIVGADFRGVHPCCFKERVLASRMPRDADATEDTTDGPALSPNAVATSWQLKHRRVSVLSVPVVKKR
eukprot:1895779-Amphidinium_carterae.1